MSGSRLLLATLIIIQSSPVEWEEIEIEGPGPRYVNQMVSTPNGLVLFGGKNNSNDGFDDLWSWNGESWTKLTNGATQRWDHGVAYMAQQNKLIVFGGRQLHRTDDIEERIELNDTWIYKDDQWLKVGGKGPGARSSFGMTYDSLRDRVIIFGGRKNAVLMGDTWEFDGDTWIRVSESGPEARYGQTLSYDNRSNTTHMFGGYGEEGLLGDHWMWDGEQWVRAEVEIMPKPRMAHAMKFDQQGRGVLFGGFTKDGVSNELWLWRGNEWSEYTFYSGHGPSIAHALGYDIDSDQFVIFGGSGKFGGEFYATTWILEFE